MWRWGGLTWGILAQEARLINRTSLIILGVSAAIFVAITLPVSVLATLLLLGMLLLLVGAAFIGQSLGKRLPSLGWLPLIWLVAFFVVLWLLQGGLFLQRVRLDNFSGLMLTLLTAVVSIVLSFPFGVLLALGRQSHLPVIRWFSIAYIEVIRGLPPDRHFIYGAGDAAFSVTCRRKTRSRGAGDRWFNNL